MIFRIFLMVCVATSIAQAQDIQYVFAENGLVIRKQPNQGAAKIGILDYGTPVEILEHTNLNLDVKDNNKKVSGQWVKIKGPNAGEYYEEGYVFNGFLTEDKIEKPLKVYNDAFSVFIDGLDQGAILHNKIRESENASSETFIINSNTSPENRYIKVKHHHDYRAIEVFQRYTNGMVISNSDGKRELIDFQKYTSSWKPLKLHFAAGNIFKTQKLSEKDRVKFGVIDKDKLQAYLNCKGDLSFQIVPTHIELKVIMSETDGYRTQKNIIFQLPLDE